MSTRPITVQISGDDRQLNEVLARALAQVKSFQAGTEQAGAKMKTSFDGANASARLLNDELGTGMSRHLTRILADSALVGPALSAALPIAAAVGFGLAIEKVYEHLSGAKDAAKELAQNEKLAEQFTKVAEQVAKIQAGMRDIGKTSQQVAINAMTEAQFALVSLQARVSMQRGMADILSKQASAADVANYQGTVKPGGLFRESGTDDRGMASALNQVANEGAVRIGLLQAELDSATAKMSQSFIDLAEKSAAGAQRAENAWIAAMREAEKSSGTLLGKDDSPAQKEIAAINEQLQKWQQVKAEHVGINAIANDYIEKLQKEKDLAQYQIANADPLQGYKGKSFTDMVIVSPAQNTADKMAQVLADQKGWYEATRTSAEKYAQALTNLNATFANNKDSDLYNRSLKQIKDTLDQTTINANKAAEAQRKAWEQLGGEVEKNIMNAAFMKESWGTALKSILEDLAQVIVKLYLMKALSKWMNSDSSDSGDGGGSGGIFGAFISGFGGGKAAGGPLSGGMSYLVGERGPELFTPGSSGAITPNHRLGGSAVYNIDARGADISVEQRVMRAIAVSQERAVQRAVATVQERNLRR